MSLRRRWMIVLALAACRGGGIRNDKGRAAEQTAASEHGGAPGGAPAANEGTNGPSEEGFAQLLIAELAKAHPGQDLHYDPAHHVVIGKDGAQVSTTNLYREWLATPGPLRPEAIQRVVSAFSSGHEAPSLPFAQAEDRLMPVVRAGLYFDSAELLPATPGDKPSPPMPHAPLGRGAAIGIGIDSPDSIRLANAKDLERWHVTFESLQATALANLRKRSDPFVQLEPGVWASNTGDSYDASRILLVDEIRALHLAGGAVALIPNRDLLLLAGAKDRKALLAIAARAEAAENEPRAIHTIALCLGAAGWDECVPDATPAIRTRYRGLAVRTWGSIYEEQKQPLQEKLGDDVFVATYSAWQNTKTGSISSYAAWTKGVPTLLPRVEFVAFVDLDATSKDKMLGIVPWDRVMKVCGAHLTSDGRSPERWSTGDYFPGAAELARLAPQKKGFTP